MRNHDRYLIVKGTCGLGNRLMVLANALEYCEKTGRTIIVDWCDGMFTSKGKNAFTEYFEIKGFAWQKEVNIHKAKATSFYPDVARNLPDNFSIDEYFHTSSANKKGSKLLKKLIHFGSGVAHTLLSEDRFKYYFVLWVRWELLGGHRGLKSRKLGGNKFCLGGDLPLSRKEEVILFGDFCPGYRKLYLKNYVSLKKEIKEEIENYSKENELGAGTVGLHIRCTDKSFQEDIDKTFQFVERFMQEHQLATLFLATDQIEVIEKAKQCFGNCLLLYKKYLPELASGGEHGIHTWASEKADETLKLQMYHDAIMEMFLLAETEYLLYQGNSTFSIISRDMSKYGNCFDWQEML